MASAQNFYHVYHHIFSSAKSPSKQRHFSNINYCENLTFNQFAKISEICKESMRTVSPLVQRNERNSEKTNVDVEKGESDEAPAKRKPLAVSATRYKHD